MFVGNYALLFHGYDMIKILLLANLGAVQLLASSLGCDMLLKHTTAKTTPPAAVIKVSQGSNVSHIMSFYLFAYVFERPEHKYTAGVRSEADAVVDVALLFDLDCQNSCLVWRNEGSGQP
jgi:hypothetical protein